MIELCDLDWMYQNDTMLVQKILSKYESTIVKRIPRVFTKVLSQSVQVRASRAGLDPYQLLGYCLWLIHKQSKNWDLKPQEKKILDVVVDIVEGYGRGNSFSGAPAIDSTEYVDVGNEVVKDIAHWLNTSFRVELLRAFIKTVKEHMKEWSKILRDANCPYQMSEKEKFIYLERVTLSRIVKQPYLVIQGFNIGSLLQLILV